jgi:hypothetical protein
MFDILKPNIQLELDEGEHIISYTRRHWVLLLLRIGIPLLLAVLVLLLAFYRAIGGIFFADAVGPEGRLVDPSNIIFLAVLTLIALIWTRQSGKGKKTRSSFVDVLFLLGVIVIGTLIYFRYQGGRVFYVDRAYERGGDVFNLALIGMGLLLLGVCLYILLDWANDYLILTNTRVVYDDTQLLVRHVSQGILIDNIQQVNLSADSYLAYFLGYVELWRDQFLYFLGIRKEPPGERVAVAYGKLVVGSLSARRLIFDWANDPAAMLGKINGELGKLRKQQEPELLRRIIEDQVYDNKQPKLPSKLIQVEEHHGPIPWLFHTNPEIDYAKEEVIWRPYWIFLMLAMFPALVGLVLATILLVVVVRLELIGGPAFVLWLIVALACLARIIWVREEHENDKYILQRDKIIDVDKKPFGPESSRVAQLGNIQDISFDQSFVESILGYGDVTILTGGAGGKFTFKHVPDPRGVQATINDYLTDFKKREKERAQQATIALIKQYHTLQREHGELLTDEQMAMVLAKVAEDLDVSSHVEREVSTQVPEVVRRQMEGALRRELWRTGLFRRRRSS